MKIGTIEISKLYIGSTEVTKAYMGTDVVYTLSAEFQEGYTAGYNDFINETTTTNPYTSGTQQYQDWQDGYTAGTTSAEHVVYQEGYTAGYGDAESGTTTTNPYTSGTSAADKWDEGYTDGYNAYVPYTLLQSVYRDSNNTGYIIFPYTSSDVKSIEATIKVTNNNGAGCLIGISENDDNDWRIFGAGNKLYYDCGSGRWEDSNYFNTKIHFRFDGDQMRVYNYDTQSYVYTGSTTRPTGKNISYGYNDSSHSATSDYCVIYDDLVFYSDNDGTTAIAHYIPVLDSNNVACLYDTISETYLYPTGGTLGYETLPA